MASTRAPSVVKSSYSQVDLVPWDPESSGHVERMVQQRIACGWKHEQVEKWKSWQKDGRLVLQWVVLSESDPSRAERLEKHTAAFPKESEPLVDSAVTLGGEPRAPNLEKRFIAVGHISLNKEYESPEHAEPAEGLYWFANFYISAALQFMGLGRAAMDAVESMAISEPLCVKTLALSTVANEYEARDERWAALERDPPKILNQDWYERRGYVVYKRNEKMWSEKDSKGKEWWFPAVFMKKDIR